MQSERESTRRLRYNKDPNQASIGTLGSLSRDRAHAGAPPVPGPQIIEPPRGASYPLRSSPPREPLG